jgi:hypothetical protein
MARRPREEALAKQKAKEEFSWFNRMTADNLNQDDLRMSHSLFESWHHRGNLAPSEPGTFPRVKQRPADGKADLAAT